MQKLEKEKGFMKEMHDADGQKITFLNMVQRKSSRCTPQIVER